MLIVLVTRVAAFFAVFFVFVEAKNNVIGLC